MGSFFHHPSFKVVEIRAVSASGAGVWSRVGENPICTALVAQDYAGRLLVVKGVVNPQPVWEFSSSHIVHGIGKYDVKST